jgi:hypothetical protein
MFTHFSAKMPAHLDQFNLLFDTRNISTANLSLSVTKGLTNTIEMFVERIHKCYLIESGTLMWAFYQLVKVLLPPRTREKVLLLRSCMRMWRRGSCLGSWVGRSMVESGNK